MYYLFYSLNEDQLTPLDLALLTGQSDIAHILIRYGAQENPQCIILKYLSFKSDNSLQNSMI